MPRLLAALRRFEKPVRSGLPRLIVLSDQSRGYDLGRQLADCPPWAILIERTYGAVPGRRDGYVKQGPLRLATTSARASRRASLDGVHWPEKRLKKRCRSAMAGLIETASAHRGLSIAKARQQGITHILVSVAFPSRSPSAGRPRGPIRLALLQRAFPDCAIYALGGITGSTVIRLTRTGLAGVALISGLKPP